MNTWVVGFWINTTTHDKEVSLWPMETLLVPILIYLYQIYSHLLVKRYVDLFILIITANEAISCVQKATIYFKIIHTS